MHQKKIVDSQHIYEWLMYLEKLLCIDKIKSNAKETWEHTTSGIGSCCVIRKKPALTRRELDTEWKNETFWTEIKVVWGYINDNTKTFKIFVANRTQQIHEGSNVSHWRYVPSKMNPADDAYVA